MKRRRNASLVRVILYAVLEIESTMAWIVTKYLITAAVVVLVSEVAKRSDKLGGFVAALSRF